MYKIKITKPAENDIKSAVLYISSDLQNTIAAENILSEFEKEIKTLAQMSARQPLVKDKILAQQGFRFIKVKNYLIFYTIREKQNAVIIQRVLYGKRDWENLLK